MSKRKSVASKQASSQIGSSSPSRSKTKSVKNDSSQRSGGAARQKLSQQFDVYANEQSSRHSGPSKSPAQKRTASIKSIDENTVIEAGAV